MWNIFKDEWQLCKKCVCKLVNEWQTMQVRNEELECASNNKLEKYPKPKCVCMWLSAGMVVNILPQAHCSD